MEFKLDTRLAQDTVGICALNISELRLMRDARYRWVMLVPQRPEMFELHHLAAPDQQALMEEISKVSVVLERLYQPGKINIGALGNLVRQLHVHIIARNVGDPAWPWPVWGRGATEPYDKNLLDQTVAEIRDSMT